MLLAFIFAYPPQFFQVKGVLVDGMAAYERTDSCIAKRSRINLVSTKKYIIHTVEPLNSGHAWDPAFCPLYVVLFWRFKKN